MKNIFLQAFFFPVIGSSTNPFGQFVLFKVKLVQGITASLRTFMRITASGFLEANKGDIFIIGSVTLKPGM